MASLNGVRMTFPGGKVFEASGNLSVTESQQPFYMVDGFQRIRTLAEQVGAVDSDTSQIALGNGARVRTWTIEFAQWEGNTESWGNASASDDVLVKLNELGSTLANAGLDSRNTVLLEYGDYTVGGPHGGKRVVPGEISLPAEFGAEGSPSTFRPTLEWRDAHAIDPSDPAHPVNP
jgi:hypothetical protein